MYDLAMYDLPEEDAAEAARLALAELEGPIGIPVRGEEVVSSSSA